MTATVGSGFGSGSGLSCGAKVDDAPPAAPAAAAAAAAAAAVGVGAGAGATIKDVPDAGLRSLDHYKRALPKWRYDLRQRLLPLVRWETPYLAYFQSKCRSPALDSYFAITANLGTHTFFMIGLPILFWCGMADFGKVLVHMLAEGVFLTGWIKDMFSLPRPLSPPLHRITMSGSVALEYGFPSTHSANAVSVAVYAVLALRSPDNTLPESTRLGLEGLAIFYALSIVIGRLYAGMHGFIDVIIGSIFGAVIAVVEYYYGPAFEHFLQGSGYTGPIIVALTIVLLVRLHPEPADDCPCFDDSVAFAAVMIGVEVGTWHFATQLPAAAWARNYPFATIPPALMGVRVVTGVLLIFAWRECMKPAMLRGLPHLFRLLEGTSMDLTRRFFTRASEYTAIPLRLRTDNVMPNVADLPTLVSSLRGPGRGRSVSVGPQSAADAYETLAYRERRRRESAGSNASPAGLRSKSSRGQLEEKEEPDEDRDGLSAASGVQHGKLAEYEQMMGQGRVMLSPSPEGDAVASEPDIYVGQHDELAEKEMFEKLVKPRVRYDVEVVTKLVIYTGIAWLAVEIIPVIFEVVGLGVPRLASS